MDTGVSFKGSDEFLGIGAFGAGFNAVGGPFETFGPGGEGDGEADFGGGGVDGFGGGGDDGFGGGDSERFGEGVEDNFEGGGIFVAGFPPSGLAGGGGFFPPGGERGALPGTPNFFIVE